MFSFALRGAVAAAAIFVASSAFAGSNLIVNGDFSSPNVGTNWGEWSSIAGWTSAHDAIEVGYSPIYGLGCANAACQNLEVNANTFGDDYQTVTGLTVGAWYTLSFLYGGRTDGGPAALDVYFGGQRLTTNSGSIGSWTLNEFHVQATATSEKLAFVSQVTSGSPSYGNEIANVALSTPELSTWAMLGLGFVGLAAAGRRARRAALSLA